MEARNAKVIVIANHKGGVHKSTVSQHLGVVLAESEFKVCLIDLDYTQGDLTGMVYGSIEGSNQKGIMHVLLDAETESRDVILQTKVKNLDIIPSEKKVMNRKVDIGLLIAQDANRHSKLQEFVDQQLRDKYDFIIIDTPPAENLISLNGLVAADSVIIPTLADDNSTEAVPKAASAIMEVKKNFNPKIDLLGVLIVGTDGRAKITKEKRKRLRELVGDGIFETEIKTSTKFKSLRRDQNNIFDVVESVKDRGAIEYYQLGIEVLKRLDMYHEASQEVVHVQ